MRPVSVAAADFHGSAGFFLRVGMIGLVTLGLFGLLALRLWSLQVVRGPHFALAAQRQTFRLIDLPAPRGQIVDAKGQLLAGTNGGLAVSVDSSVLGLIDQHGRWWPTHQGRVLLRRLSDLSGVPAALFIQRIRHSEFKSPYSSAIVLPRITRDLGFFLDEHARAERAGPAAEIEHAWGGAGECDERVDDRREPFLLVRDMQLLLRLPAAEPAGRVGLHRAMVARHG